jgi:hypothetical protein
MTTHILRTIYSERRRNIGLACSHGRRSSVQFYQAVCAQLIISVAVFGMKSKVSGDGQLGVITNLANIVRVPLPEKALRRLDVFDVEICFIGGLYSCICNNQVDTSIP